MAMIPCPECGASISDKANACPHCGLPSPAEVLVKVSRDAMRINARASALHRAKYAALFVWLPFWAVPSFFPSMSGDALAIWFVAHMGLLAGLYVWFRRRAVRKWAVKYGATTR